MPTESRTRRFLRGFIPYVVLPLSLPVVLILLPFSRLYSAWTFTWFQNRRLSTPEQHKKKVARVQQQVRQWHSSGRKGHMGTSRAAWTSFSLRMTNNQDLARIRIDDFDRVVEVDTEARVLTVEPGVMMGHLTSILIPMGWTIPVVPELEQLSVGGLICGAGIESSSTRYGYFADTALEYEVVISNGDVVTCSPNSNSDLFHALPWSHGTLGFLTAVKLPLIPAKKYIKLEYHPAESVAAAQRLLESQEHEFVEGIVYGKNKFVVTLGNMADEEDSSRAPVNHINRWYKPFFYKHVESFFSRRRPSGEEGGPFAELYPLRDYYHRHTRCYFWALRPTAPYSNSALFRLLLGWMFPIDAKLSKRVMLAAGVQGAFFEAVSTNGVVQDFVIPMQHFEASLQIVNNTVEIYPIWLCPCKVFNKPGMTHCAGELGEELYFDIGVYGEVLRQKQRDYDFGKANRAMEAFVLQRNGIQALYGPCLLTREDFRRMFDHTLYDEVRVKYVAVGAFPDVYDKVSTLTKAAIQV